MRPAFFLTVFVFVATMGAADAQTDAQDGARIAEQWCASCHQVAPGGLARDAAPSFVTLANTRGENLNWVRTRMQNPLYPITGINLSRREIEDIVAYFETLRTE